MKRFIKNIILVIVLIGCSSCANWLDVVPEGIATIDMAFNSRNQTIKYLATCYSYLPKNGNLMKDYADPAMMGADELMGNPNEEDIPQSGSKFYNLTNGIKLAMGNQSVSAPLFDHWNYYFQALRHCNVFLEDVGRVPDLPSWERDQWIAEIKTLKAYYHFILVQMYGPVPVIRENLPVSADVTAVKVVREPVDDCFDYIVQLLDEAIEEDALPLYVLNESTELGRITKAIALAIKAKVLVTAASPLYNGNTEQATLKNHDGTQLFNTVYDASKWEKAMIACRAAIDAAHEAGHKLYNYDGVYSASLTDEMNTQMSLRNAFTLRWNGEVVWGNTQSVCRGNSSPNGNEIQNNCTPALELITGQADVRRAENFSANINMGLLYYTNHGVPLEEDKTRDMNILYDLRMAEPYEGLFIKSGQQTVDLHFDREPRFYAWIGFDKGIWYGAGRYDDKGELFAIASKIGELDNNFGGYFPKKLLPFDNRLTQSAYLSTPYPWPVIRLSDLYLLYVEAINEWEGPSGNNSEELFEYLNRVRTRAGLTGVKEAWGEWSTNPTKWNTTEGMREIIHGERTIELMFEGQRFWDLRRWKTAPIKLNTTASEWGNATTAAEYYVPQTQYEIKFGVRDYFWPINSSNIDNNPNLVQNIGW